MYPKVFHACSELLHNEHFLKMNDKVMVEYIKWEIIEYLEEKNIKDKVLHIEELEKIEKINE